MATNQAMTHGAAMRTEALEQEVSRLIWAVLDGAAEPAAVERLHSLLSQQHRARPAYFAAIELEGDLNELLAAR